MDAQGANQIAVASGANAAVVAAQVEDAALSPATVLLLQMEVPVAEMALLVDRARARGARIILNLAPPAPVPEAMLRQLDLLIANEHEADWLAGRIALPPTDNHEFVPLPSDRTRPAGTGSPPPQALS